MPLILPEKKALFLHIPKTGGTSIRKYLQESTKGIDVYRHRSLQTCLDDGKIGPKLLSTFWKFAFVRNPFARAVSVWEFRGRTEPSRRHGCKTFEEFIKYYYSHVPLETWDPVEASMHPQHMWFFYPESPQLNMDFIGRFEYLQKDMNIIINYLHLPHGNLPHENPGRLGQPYPHYRTYYTPELINMVSEMYAKDIDIWKFDF